MAIDEIRARYLRDKVLTASPAQRVVMLYDRLGLDLTLAQAGIADDPFAAGAHLSHAMQIVAELQSSLDVNAGGPAVNLSLDLRLPDQRDHRDPRRRLRPPAQHCLDRRPPCATHGPRPPSSWPTSPTWLRLPERGWADVAPNDAWERVLAAVAAEAKRADALLHGPAADPTPAPEGPAGLPTEWMLPTAANSAVLPPLSRDAARAAGTARTHRGTARSHRGTAGRARQRHERVAPRRSTGRRPQRAAPGRRHDAGRAAGFRRPTGLRVRRHRHDRPT